MRVLVCGGRDYSDWPAVSATLDGVDEESGGIAVVLHGGATGADQLADDWAKQRGVTHVRYPAQWDKHGLAAGPIRNARMLTEGKPDLVVAFPGGRGTRDMVAKAKAAGILVAEIA